MDSNNDGVREKRLVTYIGRRTVEMVPEMLQKDPKKVPRNRREVRHT